MCQLLGGEERISDNEMYRSWSDGFIVNIGKGEFEEPGYEGGTLRELDGWHNDGDFFVHFCKCCIFPLWLKKEERKRLMLKKWIVRSRRYWLFRFGVILSRKGVGLHLRLMGFSGLRGIW
jgi:hypothetical protein